MNKIFINFMTFAFGAAIGSAVTWKLLKTTYSKIAQEEIDSVREMYRKKLSDSTESIEDGTDEEEPMDIDVSDSICLDNGYRPNYEEEGGSKSMKRPYVISPDEFGENDDYDVISFSYYEDGILTDDANEVVDDIDSIIGLESLEHFGEYEDDSVFVRNDEVRVDYEILRRQMSYEESISPVMNPLDEE